jgi:ATP-dependent Lhr-like helicase
LHRVESRIISRFHRMSIGTITSDPAIEVKFATGRRLGTVEESFISRLKLGGHFYFGGKLLTLKRVRDLTAVVTLGKRGKGVIPVWGGGKSPLSSELARGVRQKLQAAHQGLFQDKELQALRPSLELQGSCSRLPRSDELLIERTDTREGTNWFIFPFAGRLAHEGLAALVSYRMSLIEPMTISLAFNDYGFHLCSTSEREFEEKEWRELLRPDQVVEQLLSCMNLSEMDKRQFREVARVAGLIFQGYPGSKKSNRQVQASGGLFYDVFSKYDPNNLLLTQSRREVLDRQLEVTRMVDNLQRISKQRIVRQSPERLSPFGFPLWAESQRSQVSTESWSDRVKRMAQQLEKASS